MAKRKKAQLSRYERVKQILNQAQGDNIPDYQGYRAFWLLPIDEFQKVELYGQRMIAPPQEGDAPSTIAAEEGCGCGHCTPAPKADADAADEGALDTNCWPTSGQGGGTGPQPGGKRSDRSGLIIGLRGAYPFDGTVFQPLLWNAAQEVSESDIAFIAAWIDDGCPTSDEEDSQAEIAVKANEFLALARGDVPHKVSNRHTNEDRNEVYGLHVRKDIRCMTDEELGRLREAIACMSQYNEYWQDERSYNYWARIHTNSCQHGWEQFLPWHRLYLYFFEQQLQDYDAHITLPYWPWSAYADVNKGETQQLDTGVIPEAYRCWINADGIARLKDKKTPSGKPLYTTQEIASLEAIKGTPYNSGLRFLKAAGIEYTLDTSSGTAKWSPQVRVIFGELKRINPLWFASRWPGSVGTAAHYPTPQDIQTILSIKPFATFGGGPEDDHHFGALEEVHNGMHNFSGGVNPHYPPSGVANPDPQNPENPQFGYMTENRTTAFDPIFWAHHSNVDRLWAVWQESNPGANPEDLDGALPPWSLAVRDALSIKKLGYEYVKDSHFYPTASHVGIARFNSEKAGVRPEALDTHRKAEVRLHRVQRGNMPNASIRVYLNAPGADIDTPTIENSHYVGQVTTFHTYCYGGPGHCAVPEPRTRRFDRRRLHHHEPRNFRLDATDAVQRMVAQGEDDLSVHLVVVGIDGKPIENALFIDGVSLNFMD